MSYDEPFIVFLNWAYYERYARYAQNQNSVNIITTTTVKEAEEEEEVVANNCSIPEGGRVQMRL